MTPAAVFSPLQADLILQQGSGYFYVNASVGGIADVTFQESQGIAQVTFQMKVLDKLSVVFVAFCLQQKLFLHSMRKKI